MNPNFDQIGKAFVEQYYRVFDNKDTRANVATMYQSTAGLLTFEGTQCMGVDAITEKMKNIPLDNMQRVLSTIDCQPMSEGGVIVSVVGQLKNNDANDKVMPFCQTFILQPSSNNFFITHDIFRLALHNLA